MIRVIAMKENNNRVKSLIKAIDILDMLSSKSNGMKLMELSNLLSYPKSTVHALLSTMRDRGLVEQLDDGSYTLGIKLFEYGSSVSRNFDIGKISKPYLEELSSLTGSNTVISMFDGKAVVSFDYSLSRTGIQIIPEMGVRLPLHATSQGKLALSTLSQRDLNRLISEKDLVPFTPHTITKMDVLDQQIKEIREKGYSIEDGEYKIGLRSVSAPVCDYKGEMRYMLTTIGFFRRVRSDDFMSAVKNTLNQSKKFSLALSNTML